MDGGQGLQVLGATRDGPMDRRCATSEDNSDSGNTHVQILLLQLLLVPWCNQFRKKRSLCEQGLTASETPGSWN